MTEAGTVLVALCALVVGVAAVAAHLPRQRPLDAARTFHAALQARVPPQWAPWHALARRPEAKLRAPEAWQPDGAPLPGELAHVRSLADRPPAMRWAALFDGPGPRPFPAGDDPSEWMGVAWAAPAEPDAAWLWITHHANDVPPWAEVVEVSDRDVDDGVDRVIEGIEARAEDPARRFVLVGDGTALHVLLRAYAREPGLRDRVRAVVSAGAPIAGVDGDGPFGRTAVADWLGAWFRHDRLDTEARNPVAFLAFQWVDPEAPSPGLVDVPIQDARWPDPPEADRVHEAIEVHDLGVVMAACPRQPVWEALRWTVAALDRRDV